jgi:hypothetical protein
MYSTPLLSSLKKGLNRCNAHQYVFDVLQGEEVDRCYNRCYYMHAFSNYSP